MGAGVPAATTPPPRVADAFVLCLVLLEGTGAGFIGVGGSGRILETVVVGIGAVCAYLTGWKRGRLVAVASGAAFLLLEAHYHRLTHAHYWEVVLLVCGVTGSNVAAAYLRLGVEWRAARVAAVLARLDDRESLDEVDAALGGDKPNVGTLAYELERARRHNHSLCVLIVRPDELDELALRFGADAAAMTVRAVATAIGRSLRGTDIAVRERAHDFAVILPETSREDARMVAERIRLAVYEQRLEFGPGDVVDPTVSVAVAAFPQDATSNTQMDDVLHRALARAVEGGGNRTVMYSVPEGSPRGWGLSQDRD